jgi:hypothetical protein
MNMKALPQIIERTISINQSLSFIGDSLVHQEWSCILQ